MSLVNPRAIRIIRQPNLASSGDAALPEVAVWINEGSNVQQAGDSIASARGFVESERNRHRSRRSAEDDIAHSLRVERDRNLRINRRRIEGPDQRDRRRAMARMNYARRNIQLNDLVGAGFNYHFENDYANHNLLKIGGLDILCPFCGAKKFSGETAGMCCANGQVHLPTIEQPNDVIMGLFSGDSSHPESRHFLANIRKYNCCFQMTSFGVRKVGGDVAVEREPTWNSTFTIQGQIYHRIGPLLPLEGVEPNFLQVYFIGESEQVERRCNIFQTCKPGIIMNLQHLLQQNNNLIRQFKTSLERMPADEQQIIIRADRTPEGEHSGCYNTPNVNEVAVVIVDGQASRRDIVLQKRAGSNQLKAVCETHPSYDALQYPLIFWRGNDTFHINLKRVDPITKLPTSKNLSSMDYYAHQLMIRQDNQNFLLKCGALLNQFIVDMYAKIEAQRLLYLRLHQSKLRAAEYIHLQDALDNDCDPDDIGQRFILPSTFIGGPRNMQQYSQDALAYVRLYGRPDFFITFTCNPNWNEITSNLMSNQHHTDRHDITARVFRQKIKIMMQVITKHQVFGPTRCHLYTIEWQKRGLPHAHILVWLKNRLRPDQIDDVISAQLPDKRIDPELHRIVTKNMIHGPCGRGTAFKCCKDATGRSQACKYKYPRNFINDTQSDIDGYPLYKRLSPDDGGQVYILNESQAEKERLIDNRWIVPHCPVLSRMFDAHINVEYCNSVKSIKYICKYVHKGSDMAVIQQTSVGDERLQPNRNDEIAQYQLGRYISTNEAMWRIFAFPIHERYPTVIHLQVHLENGQRVYFNRENAANIAANPPRSTSLTEFFRLNTVDQFAQTLLYSEMPRYYICNNIPIKRRSIGDVVHVNGFVVKEADCIGRMYNVHPRHGDCFFLRLLLNHVRGPTSFDHLRTFQGQVCSTYKQACLLRGLLDDDSQWKNALQDAADTRSPSQMRSLFAVIICNCEPTNPTQLWNQFKEDMSEDILHMIQNMNPDTEQRFTDSIFNEALIRIEDICIRMVGNDLSSFDMQRPDRDRPDPSNPEIMRELNYDTNAMNRLICDNLPNLVPDQKHAFDTIIEAIYSGNGGIFFLDAPGGTGKTYLINLILAYVRARGDVILAVASSGIAATLLEGGRTAHSRLGMPIDITKPCNIKKNTNKGELLRRCKAIIWDECTMTHKNSFSAVNDMLNDFRYGSQSLRGRPPMGGVVIILAGDFRQTLPVVPRGTPADTLNACLKQSHLWQHVRKLHLTTNMRVRLRNRPEDEAFANLLLNIGDGTFPANQPQSCFVRLNGDLCCQVTTLEQLIERVFPDLARNLSDRKWLHERAILAPTNAMVDHINATIQESITTMSRSYYSIDRCVDPEQAVHFPIEFLNSLTPAGIPPHELILKVGSPIILLRNIDPPRLTNGTRLCVKSLRGNLLEATILSGPGKDEHVFIPRIPLIPENEITRFKRTQYPVRLAFAITVNKAQGQTLKVAGLHLTEPCFSHGQLYVACSRVGSPSNLFVLAPEGQTKNVVYPQALV